MERNRHSGRGLGVLATLIVVFSTIHFATAVDCWGGLSEYPNVWGILAQPESTEHRTLALDCWGGVAWPQKDTRRKHKFVSCDGELGNSNTNPVLEWTPFPEDTTSPDVFLSGQEPSLQSALFDSRYYLSREMIQILKAYHR
ncbi:heat shock protein [Colletotrichum asianum]